MTSATDGTDTKIDDVDTIEIDPFSITNKKQNTNTRAISPATATSTPHPSTLEASQTTKTLRYYLRGQDTATVGLTQNIKQIKCQCGSSKELEFSELTSCASCGCIVHAVCYAITGTKTTPYCYSCRSSTLGGIELHSNLPLLMNLRKLSVLCDSYRLKKATDIHEIMGFTIGQREEITASTMSLAFSLGLIEIQDDTKPPRNIATVMFEVDLPGVKDDKTTIEEDIYRLVYVPQLKYKTNERQNTIKKARKLLFQTTKGKCLSIDEELDQFTTAEILVPSLESDPINSSEDDGIRMDMNELKIEDEKNAPFALGKRRTDSISQDSIVGSLPINDFSSNPVITQPRRKLRKTSAAVLSSLVE